MMDYSTTGTKSPTALELSDWSNGEQQRAFVSNHNEITWIMISILRLIHGLSILMPIANRKLL